MSRRLSALTVDVSDIGRVKSLRFDDGMTQSPDVRAFSSMLRDLVAAKAVDVGESAASLRKYFKPAKDSSKDNLDKLLHLGLAGKEVTQMLFVEVLHSLLMESSSTDLKSALFSSQEGLEVLTLLLWCHTNATKWWVHSKGSKQITPQSVLTAITHNLQGTLT
jgi:hypothetical protein